MSKSKQVQDSVIDPIITECLTLPTKSSRIRFLDSKGKSRSDIVKILNTMYDKKVIYQHVRNVLITPIKNEKK